MRNPRALSDEAEVQLRLGYLGMLQGVIARLSGFSATIKTAAITVFAAMLALDVSGATRAFTVPVILGMFGFLDAYYIGRERAFRKLYEAAAQSPSIGLQDLSMQGAKGSDTNLLRSLASVAVLGFYIPLIAVAVVVLLAVDPPERSVESPPAPLPPHQGEATAQAPAVLPPTPRA